jgi:cell division protease FtsH
MKKVLSSVWTYLALVVVAGAVVFVVVTAGDDVRVLRLDQFRTQVHQGHVRTATLLGRSDAVVGELRSGRHYRATYPADYAETLTKDLLAAGVRTKGDSESPSAFESFLYDLLPTLIVVGVFLWFILQMQGGGKSTRFGRAKARKAGKDRTGVTFADVAGAEEAVAELEEIKDFLSDPERFRRLGAKIPKGVLLYGPPGTGKTLLARAVAGEAGVPFLTISGSDFVEMFVGVGAARVRDLFRQAKDMAPAIVFVDEIDAVGRHRGTGMGGGHDEREQTLNQLLVELDGFDGRDDVILMAATNRPDILDPALLRPGRFDRHVSVDAPDLRGREAILSVHARNKPLSSSVSLGVVARRTPGFTGADLANIVNEAALMAGRVSRHEITMGDMSEAVDRVMAGPERRSRIMSAREKSVTAHHEAGHALVGHLLADADEVHKVSIVARGRGLGWTQYLPAEDRYSHTVGQLSAMLAVFMGGLSAEELVFCERTTGAADDIDRATRLARAMVTEYGMSELLGPQRLAAAEDEPIRPRDLPAGTPHSVVVAAQVDAEVKRLLDEAHATARRLIEDHRGMLDRLAARLIEIETLDEDELAAILDPATRGTA